jgi:hypothetical protein
MGVPLRSPVTLALAVALMLAFALPAHAAPAPSPRDDQVAALRATTRWLALYPPDLWLGVESPGECRRLPSGRRSCPIAITIKAWSADRLDSWRCAAHVLLPAPGHGGAQHRTSADCRPAPTASA